MDFHDFPKIDGCYWFSENWRMHEISNIERHIEWPIDAYTAHNIRHIQLSNLFYLNTETNTVCSIFEFLNKLLASTHTHVYITRRQSCGIDVVEELNFGQTHFSKQPQSVRVWWKLSVWFAIN